MTAAPAILADASALSAWLHGAAAAAPGAVSDAPAPFSDVVGPYMGVFFIAYFVAFIATPLMRTLAVRNGIIDWPDLKRKNHVEPIAYLGGIAIFVGWLAAVELSYFVTPAHSAGGVRVFFPLSVVIGAGLVVLTGLLDDVYGISPRVKVGGQLLAAAALASENVGTRIVFDFLRTLSIPQEALGTINEPHLIVYVAGTVLIAVFVVGACNSINLIDGLDGLASGIVGIAAVGFLVIAAIIALDPDVVGSAAQHSHQRLVMCLALVGAVLGFLPYNFNPANIFMGDAGSLLLGYLSAATMLMFAHVPGNSLIFVTACLVVLALPITDTSLAIFRRKMRGQPIFSPDNQHIHHLLRRSGYTVRQAVFVMYGLATLFAAVGCLMVVFDLRWRYVLAVFFVLFGFILVTAYKFGYRQHLLDQMAERAAEAPPPVAPPATPAAPPAPPATQPPPATFSA